MYLNRAQKYVLSLLREYGALKQSQLETMTRYAVSEHLENLNGYLRQMHQGREIDVLFCGSEEYIGLPNSEPNPDTISAFDIIITLRERVGSHHKGVGMAQIQFDFETEKNRIHKAFVLVVHPGMESAVSEYANRHLQEDFQTVFFLCDTKSQMKKVTTECNHIFAISSNGTVSFFKNT